MSASNAQRAEQSKIKGNEFFVKGNWKKAHELYTQAIKWDNKNAVFFSNRAACSLKLNK